jgi:simple sugar transport system ATP-binding protein
MDLDEILMMSDRIAVIYDGRIVAIRDPDATDRHDLGQLMLTGAPSTEQGKGDGS